MNRKIIAANYAYFILVDCLFSFILAVLILCLFPIIFPIVLIEDAFKVKYTTRVQRGELNLWKKSKALQGEE